MCEQAKVVKDVSRKVNKIGNDFFVFKAHVMPLEHYVRLEDNVLVCSEAGAKSQTTLVQQEASQFRCTTVTETPQTCEA